MTFVTMQRTTNADILTTLGVCHDEHIQPPASDGDMSTLWTDVSDGDRDVLQLWEPHRVLYRRSCRMAHRQEYQTRRTTDTGFLLRKWYTTWQFIRIPYGLFTYTLKARLVRAARARAASHRRMARRSWA